jgi:hypothetical protein
MARYSGRFDAVFATRTAYLHTKPHILQKREYAYQFNPSHMRSLKNE